MSVSNSPVAGKSSVLSVIDFSDASLESLRWAIQLAAFYGAHLTVLYPYRLRELDKREDLSKVRRLLEAEAGESFATLVKPLLQDTGISYDFRSEVGFVSDRVQVHHSKSRIHLVVISQKLTATNRDGINELLEQLPAPLLIVPQVS